MNEYNGQNNNEQKITNTKGEEVNPRFLTENMNKVDIKEEQITNQAPLNTVASVIEQPAQPTQATKNSDIVVGKIAKEKESSPIAVLFIFLILGGILFFLPVITEEINKFLGKEEVKETPVNEEEIFATEILSLDTNPSLTLGYFTVSNIEFNQKNDDIYIDYTLSKENATVSYSDNLYIELYEGDKWVKRIKVITTSDNNTVNISALAPKDYNTITNIQLSVKNEADYDEIFLNYDILDEQTLMCDRNNVEYAYKFKEQVLYKYTQTTTVIKGLDEQIYQNSLLIHQDENIYYNTIPNVNSSLIESDTGYTLENEFVLKGLSQTDIKNDYYFKEGTKAGEINFKMEAMGYDCR